MSKTLTATAILITTMIGAGFLGIPYVIAKVGFMIGILELVSIGALVMLTMLYLGEIVLRTKEHHQLTGYAEKYLGPNGRNLMALSLIFGVYAALVAYLIAQGESWSMLLTNNSSAALPLGIALWAIMAVLAYKDLSSLKKSETLIVTLIGMLFILLILQNGSQLELTNLTTFAPSAVFVPLGVILFSFLGYTAIPEITRVLSQDKQEIKRVITNAHAFVLLSYALFTLLVVGVYGVNTPEIATISLGKPFMLLGIVTMLGAYLALSIALIDAFRTDYHLGKKEAWTFTTFIPLALYVILSLTNSASFTKIIGLGGIISGGIAMILILLMVKKAKIHGDRHPEYKIPYSSLIIGLIILLCILAVVGEIKKLI